MCNVGMHHKSNINSHSQNRSYPIELHFARYAIRSQFKPFSLDHSKSLEKLVLSAPNMDAVTDTPLANQTHPTIVGFHKTELFQSIIVTHYEHLTHNGSAHIANEELPCLPLQHEDFFELPEVQQHVCLEIASGKNVNGESIAPKIVSKGQNLQVLLPGSLRDRGDYCLVDLAYVADTNHGCQWTVKQTQFRSLSS